MGNISKIKELILAKAKIIWICTPEEAIVLDELGDLVCELSEIGGNGAYIPQNMYTWSITKGLTKTILKELDDSSEILKERQLDRTLNFISDLAKNTPISNLYVFKDIEHIISRDPLPVRLLRDLKEVEVGVYTPIIILSTTKAVPPALEAITTVVDYDLMDSESISHLVTSSLNASHCLQKEASKQTIEDATKALLGLNIHQVLLLLNQMYLKYGKIDIQYIIKEKIEYIKNLDLLDYSLPSETLADIGGNDRFVAWAHEMKTLLINDTDTFGCAKPKGYLALGIPGTAKTLSARALAGELGIPFIQFNISKIMTKFVGSSERKIEQALEIVKKSAPCVFLIDEVEKVLGGVQSSNSTDSGTLARIVSSLLNFLNDNDTGILTVMTSNDVSQLPPELTRTGRLDAMWYFSLPSEAERLQIIKIHLDKTGKSYDDEVIQEVVELNTDHYTGAELEALVQKAMWKSYARYKNNPDTFNGFLAEDFVAATEDIVTIYDSSYEKISALETWADGRALRTSQKPRKKAAQRKKSDFKNTLFSDNIVTLK